MSLATAAAERVRFVVKSSGDALALDGPNVIRNLSRTPKRISSVYVYDARGMALYERQCETPEYYLRRVENALLRDHAAAIVDECGFLPIVELGAGTAQKTRILLSHYDRCRARSDYVPIDVDPDVLTATAQGLTASYPRLFVHCVCATYRDALRVIPNFGSGRLFLFLGSSLSNLELDEIDDLLSCLYGHGMPGDFLLLGVDLDKEAAVIESAYNDAAGYGPQSSLNVLWHLNRRYGGNFLERNFRYRSSFDPQARKNEVRIESLVEQQISLGDLDFTVHLRAGELIDVEIMWKFDPKELSVKLERAGLPVAREWIDPVYRYGLFLLRRR